MNQRVFAPWWLLALAVGPACGGVDDGAAPAPPALRAQATTRDRCAPHASAFEALRTRIFVGHGCSVDACHGARAAGDLRLGGADAFGALVDVAARGSSLKRVQPGDPDASQLYRKLKAATEPGSIVVEGSPMPVGAPPLEPGALAALRLWIAAGAPAETPAEPALHARVTELLGPCDAAPASLPARATTLPAPDPQRGVQLRMPPHVAPPDSEWEGCFATYYDLKASVPARFQGASGRVFHVASTEMFQSSGSHHMAAFPTGMGAERVHDPAFGTWTCMGGAKRGQRCEPRDAASCGDDGVCTSAPKAGVACFGYGPFGSFVDPSQFGLGKSPKPYLVNAAIPGVYRDIALEGIVYWNLHAYNLTDQERTQEGAINLWYTDDTRYPEQTLSLSAAGFAGIAPFTKQDVCGSWRAPRNSTLIRLSSHTHRHGERFWIVDASGRQIYESLDYANSVTLVLDPPRVFDAADPAARTLRYCATFNNGVRRDGSPDTELVTRRSRIPPHAPSCIPTACVTGKIAAPCRGVRDNAACDSAPGRGDGLCDACPTMSGDTTEHEMFIMHPDHVLAILR